MTTHLVRRFAYALGTVAVLVGLITATQPLLAQTAINTTTLSTAQTGIGTGPNTVILANALAPVTVPGIGAVNIVGQVLYIDRELELVTGLTPTTAMYTVQRGYGGTQRADHAVGTLVYTGPPAFFNQSTVQYEPAGPCTLANILATPVIFVQSGDMYQCTPGGWAVIRRTGLREAIPFRLGNANTTYTTAGAITVEPGYVWIGSAGALTMTLANPTTEQNGMTMCFYAATAQAHIVNVTTGYNGGATLHATFTAAIGNGFCAIARAGVWYTTLLQGVTLS